MIKLINGFEVKYVEDFDEFFQNLLKAIIHESKQTAMLKKSSAEEKKNDRDIFLQDVMDNCIYVTHQLFSLYKSNEKFTKFIITGFIFNSIILSLANFNDIENLKMPGTDEGDTLH
jgi:hypothetical protein